MKKWVSQNNSTIHRILAGRSNSYLICSGKQSILVDTGILASRSRLKKNIATVLKPGICLRFLVQTHTHFDHCRNTRVLKEKENCQVVVSVHEKEFIQEGYTPLPGGTNPFSGFLARAGKRIGRKEFGYAPFVADIIVTENYIIPGSDGNIEIVPTPGHSSGSMSIIINKEIAIVGDTMIGVVPGSIFPPFADDPKELIKSWKKLLSVGCKTFLPGHGRAINRELVEKELKKYSGRFKG